MKITDYFIVLIFIIFFISIILFYLRKRNKKFYLCQFNNGKWFKLNKETNKLYTLEYTDSGRKLVKSYSYPISKIAIKIENEKNFPYIIKSSKYKFNKNFILVISNTKQIEEEIFNNDL